MLQRRGVLYRIKVIENVISLAPPAQRANSILVTPYNLHLDTWLHTPTNFSFSPLSLLLRGPHVIVNKMNEFCFIIHSYLFVFRLRLSVFAAQRH